MKIYNQKNNIAGRIIVYISILGMFLLQGCSTDSKNMKHIERYRPQTMERSYVLPLSKTSIDVNNKKEASVSALSLSKPSIYDKGAEHQVNIKNQNSEQEVLVKSKSKKQSYGIDRSDSNNKRVRKLKYGDVLTVGLYGIPEPVEVKESIDNFGCISLPLIDVIKIVGMGTSAAERKIRDTYINSGFYTDLSVVVMAMADEYFVRGEVKKPGNYPLVGERTLLQAITSASGFTDYAKMSKVAILRENGKKPLIFNCRKIAKRQIKDPLIQPGDIITVPRRILWK